VSDEMAWVAALEPGAPDVVSTWRHISEDRPLSVRREVRRRAGAGTAEAIGVQLATLADALATVVAGMTDDELRMDGGEGEWNVAEAIGHVCESRAGLSLAASKAAAGSFPVDAPTVVPGIAGSPDADRASLLRKIAQSQRLVERAARTVAGHEADPCPLDHPLVGRLRCGEWLLFAGVHDMLHLEQLHGIISRREGPAA
jgi:hypothetical protein